MFYCCCLFGFNLSAISQQDPLAGIFFLSVHTGVGRAMEAHGSMCALEPVVCRLLSVSTSCQRSLPLLRARLLVTAPIPVSVETVQGLDIHWPLSSMCFPHFWLISLLFAWITLLLYLNPLIYSHTLALMCLRHVSCPGGQEWTLDF